MKHFLLSRFEVHLSIIMITSICYSSQFCISSKASLADPNQIQSYSYAHTKYVHIREDLTYPLSTVSARAFFFSCKAAILSSTVSVHRNLQRKINRSVSFIGSYMMSVSFRPDRFGYIKRHFLIH